MNSYSYKEISRDAIPQGVRFDTTRRNQGQIVIVAYGGCGRAEHDEGDPYMSVEDTSEMPSSSRTKYYALDTTPSPLLASVTGASRTKSKFAPATPKETT